MSDDDKTPEDKTPDDGTGAPKVTDTPVFKAITSQEDFDAAIIKRLERERKKFDGFDDFKAKAEKFDSFEAEKLTEFEKLTRRVEKAEADTKSYADKVKAAERNTLVRDIADELKLPKGLLKRVQGDDEDAIRADIADLLEGLPKQDAPKKDEEDSKDKEPPSQKPKQKMTFTATGDESDDGLHLSADDVLKAVPRGGI